MLWKAALLGLAVAASFGPVNALLTKTLLTQGKQVGATFAAGACSGDAVLLCAGFVTSEWITSALAPRFTSALGLLGGCILIAVAVRSLRESGRELVAKELPKKAASHFGLAFVVTVMSPSGVLLWFAVGHTLQSFSEGATDP